MPTRFQWEAAVRHYIGCPFHHQGRSIYGLDCAGLLIKAAVDVGLPYLQFSEIVDYARRPSRDTILDWCNLLLIRKPFSHAMPYTPQLVSGDILTFWVDDKEHPRHLAMYSTLADQPTMVHAKADEEVVEQPFFESGWSKRIHAVWNPPEGIE